MVNRNNLDCTRGIKLFWTLIGVILIITIPIKEEMGNVSKRELYMFNHSLHLCKDKI